MFKWKYIVDSTLFKALVLLLILISAAYLFSKTYITENVYELSNKEFSSFNLPFRNMTFTGREGALQQVKKKLSESNIGIISQALLGIGGIGKTQLATEYSYRTLEDNFYDTIVWISAENQNTINNSYSDIAHKLGINTHGIKTNKLKKIIHGKIFNPNFKKNILFVLDNAPSKNVINKYLKVLQKQRNKNNQLHILITSRNQNWKNNSLILDIFSPEEANIFVKKYIPDAKIEDVKELTKLLQYFPLALGQALGYIRQNTNINDFISLYKKEQQKYLDMPLKYTTEYSSTLWTTFSVSLEKLNAQAKEILYLSSYLEPDKINLDLFANITNNDSAIQELQKYSLITIHDNNSYFRIHRLLQEVIKINIGKDSTWINKASKLAIKEAKLFEISNKQTWPKPRAWLFHIPILSKQIINHEDKITLLDTYGKIAIHFGLYNLAENLYLDSIKHNKSAKKIKLTNNLNELATIYWRLGDYKKGEQYCQKALDIYNFTDQNSEQSLGYSNTLHTLGRIYSRL
ncbi:MAG: tetratricopeptide repeat protein, partial [Legionellales bacterium]|nr:tetratricopeptide repeat protein [Legionellales bacterium]